MEVSYCYAQPALRFHTRVKNFIAHYHDQMNNKLVNVLFTS